MQKISTPLFNELQFKANHSERKRINFNLHSSLEDPFQRLLNYLLPGTYLRPHRHSTPEKSESILILKGRVLAIEFDNDGNIIDYFELNTELGNYGIDILPGVFHTIIPLTEAVIFEAKQGPFAPLHELDFASWAPPEGDSLALQYQKKLLEAAFKV